MSTTLKLLEGHLSEIHADLSRPHQFAAERVGFLTAGMHRAGSEVVTLLASRWHVVADEDYIENPLVGASIGSGAFRKILQYGYFNPVCIFHVHRHDHRGRPEFSDIDVESACQYVPSFFNVCRDHPHGVIVLSLDSASGFVWMPGNTKPECIARFDVIGVPLRRLA